MFSWATREDSIHETNNKGVAALEAQLEACQRTALQSLELAEQTKPSDDYGKSNAYARAMAFMKVSAKVALALAKLKNEHTSHVHVRRTQVSETPLIVEFPPPLAAKKDASPPVALDDATRRGINSLYDDWVKSRVESHGDVQVWSAEAATDKIEEDFLARRRAEAQAKQREQGGPPSNFSGSNSGK